MKTETRFLALRRNENERLFIPKKSEPQAKISFDIR